MTFTEINISEFDFNPFNTFAKKWPLLTAGTKDNFNTMTISWGHIGSIWGTGGGMPTLSVYVRPQRHTKSFMDANDMFSISVLPAEFKKELTYLGSASGRDCNKVAKTGLTPIFDASTTYFEQSRLVFICRKLYQAPILEHGFVDRELMDKVYPQKDFHTMYIGEITKILAKI